MEKLRILIEHWIEHNQEHAENYIQWAERAKSAGNVSLTEILQKIATETTKIDELFEKARRAIEG